MSSLVNVRVRFVEVQRRGWVNLGLTTLGLLLAFYGQRAIYNTEQWTEGVLFYAVAFVAIIVAWARGEQALAVPIRADQVGSAVVYRSRAQRWLALPAIVFAIIAFLTLVDNTFTPLGTTAWLTSLILFLISFWDGTLLQVWARLKARITPWTSLDSIVARITWSNVLLLAIFLLGIYFYFYRLDTIPAEMTSDHSEKIYDTNDILQGKRPIFFERNTGREPLQFYMNATVVWLGLAPLGHLALKIATAFTGLLAVPAVYLLAREWFDKETGLYAAFFMAVSLWSVAIARVGLRYPYAPLFVALSLFFLIRALRKMSRNDFLLAGLMMGLGLNGYSPFRVEILLALVILAVWAWTHRTQLHESWTGFVSNVGLMFGVMLLVFLPLLRYTVEHPEMFLYRSLTRLTSAETPIQGSAPLIFLDNIGRALQMFNIRGDTVWVNTLPGFPIVDYIIGALLLVGAVYAGYRLVRKRELPYLWLFIGIFILLLPSTLAIAFPLENPSVVRAGGAAPLVFILAALPLTLWQRHFRALGSRVLGLCLLVPLLVWCAKINSDLYFIAYDEQYRRASWNTTELAAVFQEFARNQGDAENTFIVSFPHWVDHRAVGINLGEMEYDAHLVTSPDQLREQATDPAAKLYALRPEDVQDLTVLRELYPDGVQRLFRSRTVGRDFATFYAPGAVRNDNVQAPPPFDPTGQSPPSETVMDRFDLNGETLEITHSIFDQGRVNDLFDGNPDYLVRTKDANPLILDVVFPSPRPIGGIRVQFANGEYAIRALVYDQPNGQPVAYDRSFTQLPTDPTVEMDFENGPDRVRRLRLELTQLNAPEEVHVHVRDLEFK